MYDRVYKHGGYAPWAEEYDQPITTHDEAIEVIGPWLEGAFPSQMEELEDELELSEEYKLANWMREFRHKHESEEDERSRYEHEDKQAEELARHRRRRRGRN